MVLTLLVLVAGLAFANGANDNCKGVATLVGYGAAEPRAALLWAMITTAVGALVSFWLAAGMVNSFGTGLLAKNTAIDLGFFAAVLAGAMGWVLFATRTGLPVSTTHAITGSLVGAGLVTFGHAPMQWRMLGTTFALPLVLSPLLSLASVYLLGWPLGLALSRVAGKCVCVTQSEAVLTRSNGAAAAAVGQIGVVADTEQACAATPLVAAVSASKASNATHWLSSGMVGFARGWNDTPKIAALGLIAVSGDQGAALCFAIVTVAMAAGGMIAGRRVLETLARKVTPMPLAESLTASLMTATLVGLASWNSLPVSTTHVSTGAIVGAGLKRDPRGVRWGMVGEIVLSWIVTLPVAALIAAAAALVVHRF
jgi:inorganic phosphate transporter, PiT family